MVLQGAFVKIGDFIKFKGFLVEFLENRRSWEKQNPQKIARKVDFSEPRLYNAPSLHTVKPNQKKGPKRKIHEFRPFLWILVFFLGKTSTIHIELLFRNAPGKSSWTGLSLVWFAGATSDCQFFRYLSPGCLCNLVLKSPQVGEDCTISRWRNMREILSRLWLSWFLWSGR